MIGLKPYKKEDENKFLNIDNLDVYSFGLMAEKDVMEIFKILNYDSNKLKIFVNCRNEIAHASGKINAKTLDDLFFAIHPMIVEMKNLTISKQNILKNVHINKMKLLISAGYTTEVEYENYFEELIFLNEISYVELSFLKELSYKKYLSDDVEDNKLRAQIAKQKLVDKFNCINNDFL